MIQQRICIKKITRIKRTLSIYIYIHTHRHKAHMQMRQLMAGGGRQFIGFTIIIFLLLLASESSAIIMGEDEYIESKQGCEYVFTAFPYCLEFLTGLYYKPSRKCCNHIKKLNMIAKHRKGNAQRFCYCIEAMVRGTQPPLLASRIQQLPITCNTSLSFPISASMDCSQ